MKLKKLSTNIFRQLGVRLIALRGARDRDRDPGLRARAATLPANARARLTRARALAVSPERVIPSFAVSVPGASWGTI